MEPAYRSLAQTSEPAEEPVDLPTLKNHLRVSGDDDDDLILGYAAASREWVEKETNRALVTRSYQLRFDGFTPTVPLWYFAYPKAQELPFLPVWGTIRLPKPPLVAIDSIAYLDLDGTPRVLDPSAYQVIAGGRGPGWIAPAYGLSWPLCRVQMGSVVVSYHAGYGTAQDVPKALKSAIMLQTGNLYRFREPVSDLAMMPIPFGVKALLSAYRWKASA